METDLFKSNGKSSKVHVHVQCICNFMQNNNYLYNVCLIILSLSLSLQPLVPESVHPLDFSHIYPTPPSVESAEEKFEDGKIIGTTVLSGVNFSEEKNELLEQYLMIVCYSQNCIQVHVYSLYEQCTCSCVIYIYMYMYIVLVHVHDYTYMTTRT